MKLIYKGKFDGNPESLPNGEHMPGAVRFKEFDDPKKIGIVANGIAFVIIIVLIVILFWRGGFGAYNF